MKVKLTKTVVENAPISAEAYCIWDEQTPGFGVKIRPSGKRVYIAQFREHGRVKRMTFGAHGPAITIEKARKAANDAISQAALGGNPATAKIDLKTGPAVKELGERYLSEHAEAKKKASSARNDKAMIKNIINPKLGTEKVATVTRAQISELHHSLQAKPYAANRTLALLGKMFSLAEKWGLRPDNSNPCRHIEKFKETKRRRFMSIEELSRLGAVLAAAEKDESEPATAIAALRLLIFSGARRDEVLTLKWSYVNWQLNALILADSKTGEKTIPLSAPARAVLEGLPVIAGNDYVLPGHRKGQRLVGLNHIWLRIRAKAKLPDLRLHDLRHSYASVGAAAGLGLPIIGSLLGHMDASTTQRYAHLALSPMQAATELIGKKIDAAMKKKPKLRRVK
jgi:integrase